MELFGRQVAFQFGQPGEDGTSLTGLRVAFNVKHTLSGDPSTGTISVWGIASKHLAEIQRKGAVVRLLAGYRVPQIVFSGNPIKDGARIERRGPERVLTVEAKDGGRETQRTRLELTWATETTLRQVVDRVGQEMGLPLGTIQIDENVRFVHGITLAGSARDILDRVAEMSRAKWTIRDGELVIVGDGLDTGETAVVISTANKTLIGSPTLKEGGKIEVTTLLIPSMRPGKAFELRSATLNGVYIAQDVVFQGESGYGTAYYTKIVGRERGS